MYGEGLFTDNAKPDMLNQDPLPTSDHKNHLQEKDSLTGCTPSHSFDYKFRMICEQPLIW